MTSHVCYHCGQANDPVHSYQATVLGEPRTLCCPGCQAVATAIVDNGLEDYYRFRTEPAVQGDADLSDVLKTMDVYDDPALQEEFVFEEGKHKQIQLTVEGITCAACGWLIEKQLARVDGIEKVAVNVQARRAMVTWHDDKLSLSHLLSALKRIGYTAIPFQPDQHEASYKKEQKSFLKKLGLAGLMTMQVMMLMAGLYFDLFGSIDEDTRRYFHWVALVLTTPVVLYSGSIFYLGALKALSARTVNMDVPVTLAIFGTYGAGLQATLTESGEVYFESICMFIFLLLLSRFLEHRSRHRAAEISANMTQHIPVSATLLLSDGQLDTCLAKKLNVGDRVLIKPGETVPIDGVISDGTSSVDESMLSGEFVPVRKQPGDKVFGGTVNQAGTLTVTVTSTLKHALVNQIIRLQAEAMASKPRIAQLADRFSRYFVCAVLLISAATFTFWWWQQNEDAFWITIAVLVATCPCALGLATPSALTCAMAKLNRQGILLKRADVLEQLNDIDTVALDKTGTLTVGEFAVSKQWFSDALPVEHILQLAATLESRSEHPIARAFSRHDLAAISEFSVTPGAGIKGNVNGETYFMGARHFCPHSVPHTGFDANVYLFTQQQVLAAFLVTDSLREDAAQTLQYLKSRALILLSGDAQSHVDTLASELPLQQAIGGLSPEQKYQHVQALQQRGQRVMMLGDGINDAPVLASADVSVAVGGATDVAKTAADIVLLGDKLLSLTSLFELASRARRKIIQNMAWAIGYNVLILPFAVSGVLSPWMAVVGMSLSSIIVVSNSTRLLR
ncbi:heavy metal translocating P-type ATPase [Alteromonas sp. ASW11-19]|uniref:Heavy metal translocating P-type ATPase n=1 Tax=Alteromonas salexigens TaxID=2982530 RepID=A0ABT2VLI9_9ALTE|nr:heavy metal translocating P-type ATPase [Alteromonas salexigens]MCU7554119.1 heavy metal translocating P-type ATPase [Alteromonas salexigens]